ncbi:hypothetical protein BPT24_262 [Tenacibaculum phage pT24]|uniref:Nucleotidyltransferase n=1 Tax=Tenacibaculum phage pT24 TaxID=1880590 RepID=A0A1B4XX48_9CAUD|nr:hypothetical protein HYP10_gp266 [Tenacibaculum phage pT24]BAV39380.1 hypothetical protein BPT24_262 [Tenacibaculum phage pT24]
MNYKINKEHADLLLKNTESKLLFGSRLLGTNTDTSDYDYICLYDFKKVFGFHEDEVFIGLPNIHSLQFDDTENNTQYVFMTKLQYIKCITSGDGTMAVDTMIFDPEKDVREDPNNEILNLVRTSKVIKAYLGVAKRDLKLHPHNPKKRFHAMRSLYIANSLMDGELPKKSEIQKFDGSKKPEYYKYLTNVYRERFIKMVENQELKMYYLPSIEEIVNDIGLDELRSSLLGQILILNNIREFRY